MYKIWSKRQYMTTSHIKFWALAQALPGLCLIPCCSHSASAAILLAGKASSSHKSASVRFRSTSGSPVPIDSIIAPANVAVQGAWMLGSSTDKLSWNPVQGAVSYNVYFTTNYDAILTGVIGTSCSVPANAWHNSRYTVTAVNAIGQESIPSTPVNSLGAFDPAVLLTKPVLPPQGAPKIVDTVVEWNLGLPRIRLNWQARNGFDYFNIYRDSVLLATGITPLAYIDTKVKPGETHTYAVSEVSIGWLTLIQETIKTASAPVVIPGAQPQFPSNLKVIITDVAPNDDSAKIYFNAVPGALDYRAYKVSNPAAVKYSGGALSIEMSNLDPVAGDDVIVEAVDKLGPFQTMDGMNAPGIMQLNGVVNSVANGQGDPTNVPNVVAASDIFHANTLPMTMNGTQSFLDNFRNEQPLIDIPYDQIDPIITGGPKSKKLVTESQNNKWIIRTYDAHPGKSHLFFASAHFMDTLYDYNHVLRGKTIVIPKSNPVLTSGRVLHVTFEVDAHLSKRRLLGLIISRADDHLVMPTVGGSPTKSGNSFDWQIHPDYHQAETFIDRKEAIVGADIHSERPGQSIRWQLINKTFTGGLNGNMDSLDNRHKFDLYLSSTRYLILEEGSVMKDVNLTQILNPKTHLTDNDTLAWMNNTPLEINFYHSLYHSDADRDDILSGEYFPFPYYWFNNRPYGDERHWDNMGFEVLNTFPASF